MSRLLPKLLPFVLLSVLACSNEDHTNQDLRTQIELKDRQKSELQKETRKQSEIAEAKSKELADMLLVAGPEVVKKVEATRDEALRAKAAAEAALASKNAELETIKNQLREKETLRKTELEAAQKDQDERLAEKTAELETLQTRLDELKADSSDKEAIQDAEAQVDKAKEDLALLTTEKEELDKELETTNETLTLIL